MFSSIRLSKVRDIASAGTVTIDSPKEFTLEEFMAVVRYDARLEFSDGFQERVRASRRLIDKFLEEGRIIYGVTTGFGDNVRYTITTDEAVQLQKNIVRSHAAAVGNPLSRENARASMMMTIINLGQATSGISLEMLELIRNMLNMDLYPYAPSEGSVGYLGVEAHMAMAYIGEGHVYAKSADAADSNTADSGKYEKLPAAEAFARAGLEPVTLQCKEGLSLLNGSMIVTAISLVALFDAMVSMKTLDLTGALCYEALQGTTKALDLRIHENKSHPEQVNSAVNLAKLLEGSGIMDAYRDVRVQDPYVLRSMPHIHAGAFRLVKEAFAVIMEEMHSVSDNPEIFPDGNGDGEALMCGNFDGTLIGSHDDMLAMAAAIAATEAERCTNRMVDHNLNNGLPSFLVANPGLNNGFMIPQYTAAGLCAEIKLLAVPATCDSISTCASQEDPVSMAYNSANRALEAVRKLQYVMAIDIMTALQAIDLGLGGAWPEAAGAPGAAGSAGTPEAAGLCQSPVTGKVRDFIRKSVPFFSEDRFVQPDIETIFEMVRSGQLADMIEDEIGEILL